MKVLLPTVIGVGGVALNTKGKYLVTLRNDSRYKENHLKWQVPGGGLEPGEQPEATLVREFQEELGVVPTIIFPTPMVKITTTTNHKRLVLICFLVSIADQPIVLDQTENTEFKWITVDEIPRFSFLPLSDEFVRNAHKLRMRYGLDAVLK